MNMMALTAEEVEHFREEMRNLRQRTARAERSVEHLREKTERQAQEAESFRRRIKELERENKGLKEEIVSLKAHEKKLASMLFKSNVKKPDPSLQTAVPSQERRTRGAQTGHTGHGKKTPLTIDEEKTVFLTHCPLCTHVLNESDATYTRVSQDIPTSQAVTTKFTIERQWCRHCEKEVHAIPEATIPGIRIGLNTIILICLLKYRQRVPLEKIAELLRIQHGMTLTSGGIQKILHTLSRKFAPAYTNILAEIRAAPFKHADETTWRIEGQNNWCWLFATPEAAFYTIETSRGKGVPDRVLGAKPEGVLVRDDYASYTHLTTMEHQSCWAHLLRVSHEATKQPTASKEVQSLHGELKGLFKRLQAIVAGSYERRKRDTGHATYARRINKIIARTYVHEDAKDVQTRITNQGTNLLTALLHENVPLTNNHAERQIRPMAVIRKISGGSQSRTGSTIQAVNMTIMQTLALRGQDYLIELQRLLTLPSQRFVLEKGE